MPSFDVVCELNKHELANAIDQANREIENRFDFKGTDSLFSLEANIIKLSAPSDFQVKQMMEILKGRLAKRGISLNQMKAKDPVVQLNKTEQEVTMVEGIDQEFGKKIVKIIKDQKMKAQPSIQGDKVRVTSKSKDELQEVIAMLRKQDLELPVQFTNFRD